MTTIAAATSGRRPRDQGQAAGQDLPLQYGVLPVHRRRRAPCVPALLDGGPTKVAVDRVRAVRRRPAGRRPRGPHGADRRRRRAAGPRRRRRRRGGRPARAVVALEEAPGDVVDALSTAPPVQLLEPGDVDPFLQFIVPFALAFVFFITSFTFGLQIAQSVTEEKQTRIVEILVASVPVRALLAGKVAAMTLLAFAPDRPDRPGHLRRDADRRRRRRRDRPGRPGDRLVPAVLRRSASSCWRRCGPASARWPPARRTSRAPRPRCRWR